MTLVYKITYIYRLSFSINIAISRVIYKISSFSIRNIRILKEIYKSDIVTKAKSYLK